MLNNGLWEYIKWVILLEIGRFLRNKSALYRVAFFLFELKKGYCFYLYLNNETGSFVLRKCLGAKDLLKVAEQRKGKYKWGCL